MRRRINVTMKQGANFYPDVYNMFPDVWYQCNGVSQTVDVDERLKCTRARCPRSTS